MNPSLAPMSRRFIAMIYDGLFIMAFSICVVASIVTAMGMMHVPIQSSEPLIPSMVVQGIVSGSAFFFHIGFWVTVGQTPGMKVWRLRVENVDGSLLSVRQASWRFIAACVSFLCLGMGYWLNYRTSWHDRWSRSRVVIVT